MNRREFLKKVLLSGLVLPPIALFGSYAQAMSFDISQHTVQLPNLKKPLRIAHLSDLHFGAAHKLEQVQEWVKATLAQNPDLVLLTGDLVHGEAFRRLGQQGKTLLEEFGAALTPLSQVPLGAFACLGNHDYALRWSGFASMDDLKKALEKNNIPLMVNTSTRVRDDVFVAAIDDLWHGVPNIALALDGVPSNVTTLLMSHNPDFLPIVPKSVALMLSGHTHGGQVRIPGIGAIYSVTEFGERYQQGFITEKTLGFVSRGLGTGPIAVRAFCAAELVILECQPK